jgi:hypothetical protein
MANDEKPDEIKRFTLAAARACWIKLTEPQKRLALLIYERGYVPFGYAEEPGSWPTSPLREYEELLPLGIAYHGAANTFAHYTLPVYMLTPFGNAVARVGGALTTLDACGLEFKFDASVGQSRD